MIYIDQYEVEVGPSRLPSQKRHFPRFVFVFSAMAEEDSAWRVLPSFNGKRLYLYGGFHNWGYPKWIMVGL